MEEEFRIGKGPRLGAAGHWSGLAGAWKLTAAGEKKAEKVIGEPGFVPSPGVVVPALAAPRYYLASLGVSWSRALPVAKDELLGSL